MPQASLELFRLGAATPEGAVAHGQALAYGSAEAVAELHRGFSLAAGVELNARADGEAGKLMRAALTARAQASAGVALQAVIPIDLFDPSARAGLIARFRAQAAASASIALKLGLNFDEFRQLVRDRMEPPLDALAEVFLSEVIVEAGLWARASFSAEIYGELVLGGSLLPSAVGGAGFSCSAGYGAGWGGGAGYQFVANIGFDDPARLLDRLADLTAELLLAEAQRHVTQLSPSAAKAAAPAMSLVGVVVPLASRSLYRLGFELATGQGDANARAARAIGQSFVRQAQEQLLRTLVDVALQRLGRQLDAAGVRNRLDKLTSEKRSDLVARLNELRGALAAFDKTPLSPPDAWVGALVSCLEPVDGALATGLLTPATEKKARHAVAIAWAAGVLAERIMALAASASGAPFGGPAPVAPGATGPAATVAAAVGGSPSALTLTDLVGFLAGADPLAQLNTVAPEAAHVLSWLAKAIGTPEDELVETLLVGLANPSDAQLRQLLTDLGPPLGQAIQSEIVPKLINPIKQRNPDNDALRLWLDQTVVPMLVSLPAAILPELPNIGSAEGERRLREAISAVLLQSVGQFVLASVDVLSAHALRESERGLRDLGQKVADAGEAAPELMLLASAASRAVLPVSITPADVAALFELAADVTALADRERGPVMREAGNLLAAGLGAEATRAAALEALATTDDPPRQADLDAVFARVQYGALNVIELAGPRTLELIVNAFANEVKLLVRAIDDGAKAVVAAAVAGAQWIGAQLDALRQRLAELERQLTSLSANIAAWVEGIATRLEGLAAAAVAALRDYGLSLIEPLIANFAEWAKVALRDLYRTTFDSIAWLVQLPANVLADVAGWVKEILEARMEVASNDEGGVRDAIRQRIHNAIGADAQVSLALEAWGQKVFDIGTITIPANAIGGVIADFVLADPLVTTNVRDAAQAAVQVQAAQTERQTLQLGLAGAIDQQAAAAAAADLVPGAPMDARFVAPAPSVATGSPATVRLRLEGINRTFVQSVLKVPRRVAVRVNGQEYDFDAASWQDAGPNALELEFLLTLAPPVKARSVPVAVDGLRPVQLNESSLVKARLDDSGAVVITPASGAAARRLGVSTTRRRVGVLEVEPPPEADAQPDVPVRAIARVHATARPAERASGKVRAPGVLAVKTPSPLQRARKDAQGRLFVEGVAGANAIQVAVSDGQGRNASASQVVFLQPALTVTVEPATIAAGTEVEFTVRAKDAATGTTVDDATGVVLIDGIIVGRLGRPIKHKFQVQPARGRRREQVVVRVAPYAEADVPLVFERAPDDRECAQLKEEIAALRLELDRLGGRARRDKQAELEQLLARSRQLRCR